MTVEQHDVVDFIIINASDDIVMKVYDHLSWDNVNEYLFCLQEKLNRYIIFIESGESLAKYRLRRVATSSSMSFYNTLLLRRLPGSLSGH